MSKLYQIFAALAVLALGACSSASDPNSPQTPLTPAPAGEASVQVLHASPDAPPVNITVATTQINDVDYKTGTGILTLPSNTYPITVEGILPDGTATVIGPVNLTFEANTRYSILAVGAVADIAPLVLSQPDTDVPAGSARLRVVHAAPMAPEVSVFATAPGADLSASAPVGTFSFGGDLGPVDVPAGDYQIRVTTVTPADPLAVVYDAGTVTLADGANLLISAVENTTTGLSPISLIVQDGAGSAELLDVDTPADVRVFHASPDTPNVDVVVNDDFANPLVSDLAFPNFTPFVSVPAATYNIKVADTATQTVVPIDVDLALEAGISYDVLAVDTFTNVNAFLAIDDRRPVATESKVRIIHASPGAGTVDIYVTAPGTDISMIEPTLTGVPFPANTGFLSLTPGDYEVTVTQTGMTMPAIGPAAITIMPGGVYTAIARDAQGGGGPFDLILADDFVPPMP